jgi:MFS family permease
MSEVMSAPLQGGLLARERTVAGPTFNRWLAPPAALAIHLCIGMAYGFSVFWLPMTKLLAGTDDATCKAQGLLAMMSTTACNWSVPAVTHTFEMFIAVLGIAAALWGGWLEHAGPRKAGFIAAICWGGGMVLGGVGVQTHQLWLLWLGCGIVGGVGQGLGYISPVSTLIKWFPDRRGMATGMAIMGFGGGAMIGAPLANLLMNHFRSESSVGVWQTFAVMGLIYLVFMLGGAFGYRVPPAGWQPAGWTPPTSSGARMVAHGHVHLNDAHKTLQFWLIWAVLCLNVSAGIGVIAMASPMLQEIFGGALIGHADIGFTALDDGQKKAVAGIAAGFTGLISLFNIGGRFFWASLSDRIGRKTTYFMFFALGIALYGLAPSFAHMGSIALFVASFCVILSMYGGGFSTVPAYLADIFGTQFVGAIHGRLLTAWSTAGVLGPLVVTYIRETQIAAGVPRQNVYDNTMYILAGFLVLGLICNALVRALPASRFMKDSEVAALQARSRAGAVETGSFGIGAGAFDLTSALAWAAVGIPIAWGVWITLSNALVLFR